MASSAWHLWDFFEIDGHIRTYRCVHDSAGSLPHVRPLMCRMVINSSLSLLIFLEYAVPSGSSSDGTFVGSWRAHQIVAEILSSPQAEQNQIIEVACGEDAVLRSRVMRMIASIESATGDRSSEFSTSDSLHGTGDLVVRRKLECSATRETWTGHPRDDSSSDLLIHIFSTRSDCLETTVAGFETCQGQSIEQLVSHGKPFGRRASEYSPRVAETFPPLTARARSLVDLAT